MGVLEVVWSIAILLLGDLLSRLGVVKKMMFLLCTLLRLRVSLQRFVVFLLGVALSDWLVEGFPLAVSLLFVELDRRIVLRIRVVTILDILELLHVFEPVAL